METERMVKERSHSIDSGWSDPRDQCDGSLTLDGFLSLGSPSFEVPISVEELGIAIPDFLQPLLGLDFVPYLPGTTTPSTIPEMSTGLITDGVDHRRRVDSSATTPAPPATTTTTTTTTTSTARGVHLDVSSMSLEEDSEIPLPPPDASVDTSGDSDGIGLCREITQDEEEEAFMEEVLSSLQPGAVVGSNGNTTTPHGESSAEQSRSLKKNRRKGGGLLQKVRGKITNRRERRLTRSGTWTDENQTVLQQGKHRPAIDPLAWFREQQQRLETHQNQLRHVQTEAKAVEARTVELYQRIDLAHSEVANLQNALILAEQRLRQDISDFEKAKAQLLQLEEKAIQASQAVVDSIQKMKLEPQATFCSPLSSSSSLHSEVDSNPSDVIEVSLDGRAENTNPNQPLQIPAQKAPQPRDPHCSFDLQRSESRQRASTAPPALRVDSFMRVHDLNLGSGGDLMGNSIGRASSQSSLSVRPFPKTSTMTSKSASTNGFIFVDRYMSPILENLSRLGYEIVTDESDRFVPTSDTKRLLAKFDKAATAYKDNVLQDDWPIRDWKLAHDKEVLVWTGDIGHNGFGSDWPVVKGRTLVEASPRDLVEFMMDSSRIKEYSKMSQGRKDLVRIQKGLDVTADESVYGFAGDCKIVRSLNQPRFLPTTIETLSLYYSKPLETAPGSYMTVIRSVFEDDSGVHKSTSANTIRSEMLLGVLLFRPANAEATVTEFTTITHAFSPGVPEFLARRVAPSSAYSLMKDIQAVFSKK